MVGSDRSGVSFPILKRTIVVLDQFYRTIKPPRPPEGKDRELQYTIRPIDPLPSNGGPLGVLVSNVMATVLDKETAYIFHATSGRAMPQLLISALEMSVDSHLVDAIYSLRTSALWSILLLERSNDVRHSSRTASARILSCRQFTSVLQQLKQLALKEPLLPSISSRRGAALLQRESRRADFSTAPVRWEAPKIVFVLLAHVDNEDDRPNVVKVTSSTEAYALDEN